MNRRIDARWLRNMAQEAAKLEAECSDAELDWNRIERGIFSRLDAETSEPQPISKSNSASKWPVWAGLASVAAVAAAIVLAWPSEPINAPSIACVESNTAEPSAVDDRLETVTGGFPVTLDHDDWARFRLSPRGRYYVLTMDDRVSFHLIEGKIEADVQRHKAKNAKHGGVENGVADDGVVEESVVVRAQNLEVAVRGTLFSVEIRDGKVHVQVQRGAVTVRPVLEQSTASHTGSIAMDSWLVEGPSTSVFDGNLARRIAEYPSVLDPISLDVSSNPDREPQQQPASAVGNQEPERSVPSRFQPMSASKPREPISLPAVLTSELAGPTLRDIAQGVTECHRAAVPPRVDGVTIQAQTRIFIRVAPDGHVVFARFEPPLSPKAQVCASSIVQDASFPRALAESALELPLQW